MVSPDSLPLISDFRVLRDTGLPVHYALSVTFKNKLDDTSPLDQLRLPLPLMELFAAGL